MKIVIAIMVMLVFLFGGCAPSTVAVPTTIDTGYLIYNGEFVTRFLPVYGVTKILTTVGSDGIFPPEIVMSKVNYGAELSTWTWNIPDLGVKGGEPLSLYIFNRTSEKVTYNVSYQTPSGILKDDDKNEYQPFTLSTYWVELSDETITVPPETVAAISVRILVPAKAKGFSVPDKWCFQLLVSPEQEGNIQRAFLQNWLIGMK